MVFYNKLEKKIVESIFGRIQKEHTKINFVLDAGASHFTANLLNNYFPNSEIVCINIDKTTIDRIKSSHPHSNTTPILASAEKMPFKDGVFDLIYGREVFEHIFFPEKFLNEAKRISKNNSKMLQITPNLAAWHNRILLLFGYSPTNYTPIAKETPGIPNYLKKRLKNSGMHDHPRVFTFKGLKEIFNKDGLELIEISDYNYIHEGRPFNKLRKIIYFLTPKGWHEDVIIFSKINKN